MIKDKKSDGNKVKQLLTLTWQEYYHKVTHEDEYHSTNGRKIILETARRAFQEYNNFSSMPPNLRKGIAGFVKFDNPYQLNIPNSNSDRPPDWGWFGGMKGSGKFKNRVNKNDKYISAALDTISLDGKITNADFINYQKEFNKFCKLVSFKNPIATSTRLLSLKRPDYFICINLGNRKNLQGAFGVKQITYENYWEIIIDKVINSKWWNAPMPEDSSELEIYKARAAFLDAIYYEE